MTKVVEVLIGGRLSYIDIKVIFNGVNGDPIIVWPYVSQQCSDFIVMTLAAEFANFVKFCNWNLVNILQKSLVKY